MNGKAVAMIIGLYLMVGALAAVIHGLLPLASPAGDSIVPTNVLASVFVAVGAAGLAIGAGRRLIGHEKIKDATTQPDCRY